MCNLYNDIFSICVCVCVCVRARARAWGVLIFLSYNYLLTFPTSRMSGQCNRMNDTEKRGKEVIT